MGVCGAVHSLGVPAANARSPQALRRARGTNLKFSMFDLREHADDEYG